MPTKCAKNLDVLFNHSDNILIKVSPILDITSAINELKFVKEVHVVAVNNEVKELLFILEKGFLADINIKTSNLQKVNQQEFNFTFGDSETPIYGFPKKYIYEPNAAILKSGGFSEIAIQFNLEKLQKHSHLYTSDGLIDFPGRRFELKHNIPFDKKKLKKLIPNNKANITTRNFPLTVSQIRKKTGLKDGGDNYLFCTIDCVNKKIILICQKV